MKSIHPELTLATVRCSSCGAVFQTRTTRTDLTVDVCSECHPAYTGHERPVSAGHASSDSSAGGGSPPAPDERRTTEHHS